MPQVGRLPAHLPERRAIRFRLCNSNSHSFSVQPRLASDRKSEPSGVIPRYPPSVPPPRKLPATPMLSADAFATMLQSGRMPRCVSYRQANFLTALTVRPSLTRANYQVLSHISANTAQLDIAELLDAGVAVRRGAGPSSRYCLVDRFDQSPATTAVSQTSRPAVAIGTPPSRRRITKRSPRYRHGIAPIRTGASAGLHLGFPFGTNTRRFTRIASIRSRRLCAGIAAWLRGGLIAAGCSVSQQHERRKSSGTDRYEEKKRNRHGLGNAEAVLPGDHHSTNGGVAGRCPR